MIISSTPSSRSTILHRRLIGGSFFILFLGLTIVIGNRTRALTVEICFWRYHSITRTIDFLLTLVLIAISKPPYTIGTIEHTSLPFFSSLCFCLLPTVDLLAICVSLSTVDSLGSSLSTEKLIKQFINSSRHSTSSKIIVPFSLFQQVMSLL